ncbi:hypothetical protein BX600DRAFT_381072 [Xylariales sp. PMI_506]|nr:hypothetical protein BX600DRAFT_381072 [Xylariales sp. PMI_506]
MVDFDWDPDYVPNTKLGMHIMQVILGFVIFILEIILFRADNSVVNGNNGWPFGLCFLCVPAWIYLIMSPRWKRSQKLAEPHTMLAVDAIFTIFWLSAFASQAAYNTANSCGSACSVSKAIVAFAFFQILFWAASTVISGYTLRYYKFQGSLPGYDKVGSRSGQNIDPDKAAFSMAPHDEEAYAPIHGDDHDEHQSTPYNADSYGSRPMFDSETDYRPHSTSPPHENPFDNTYRAHSTSPLPDTYGSDVGGPRIYAPPSAEDYDDGRPAQFPTADYTRTLS